MEKESDLLVTIKGIEICSCCCFIEFRANLPKEIHVSLASPLVSLVESEVSLSEAQISREGNFGGHGFIYDTRKLNFVLRDR
jgi:hypothetical protein